MKKPALIFVLLFLPLSWGALLSEEELRQAAAAWLAGKQIFAQGTESFAVASMEPVFSAAGTALPLYVLHLNPTGYLVLSADNTLPPVLAFSLHGKNENISRRQATPFLALFQLQPS